MQNRFLYSICLILVIYDLLIINSSFFFAHYYVGRIKGGAAFNEGQLAAFNFIWIFCSNVFQLYGKNNIIKVEQIFRRTWKSIGLHIIVVIISIAFLTHLEIPKVFLGVFYTCCVINFIISRFSCTLLETILIRRFKISKPVAVMGLNDLGLRLAAFFEENKNHYAFKGFLDSEDPLFVDESGTLLPRVCEQIQKAAANKIKEVYVPLNAERISDINYLAREAERQCIRLKFVPDFGKTLATPFRINYLGDFPILSIRTEPLEDVENRFRKRLSDVIFSSLVVILILSWLFPLIALAIKLQSKGPVIFKQLRNGRDNKIFYCYKFRSMKLNPESDERQARQGDERITAIGRFLRRTSLDELPQFFNVLMGDMSVIGPRPHMLKHTEQYRAIIDRYMIRHYLKPGITGWAQVNGLRGETSTKELMEKRVEHDIWYLENWSMMLDIKIAFLTVINIFKGGKNVY